MSRVEVYKLIPETQEATFGTLAEIAAFAKENNIPDDAVIQYAGCGSHRIEFLWMEEPPQEPFDDYN